ncbi:nucleotide-binding protein [Sunxiuqinia dokdonensis]|uniref:4Fe-4S ferredoxin-type domain-containing protein n=1 Tax=Sunxiuqinia dokdonensis TaxID=1409788 RepID=A0A0L8VEE8_9BACT|nr:ATP-binding protein [Sunxiuqinia dokdonensis]KOH46850.1 hypothetical protein NC99_02500 [Sunxiuqinia dokdonensis]
MKIAVASGKGGTGKTLVSTNLFNVIQKSGFAVDLIDCDAEEPNALQFIHADLISQKSVTQNIPVIDKEACTFCGKCEAYCHYNAIVVLPKLRHIQVVEDLCHDCGACEYACPAGAISWKSKTTGTIRTYAVNNGSSLIEGRIEIGVYSSVPLIKEVMKSSHHRQLAIVDAPPGTSCPFIATVSAADFMVLVTEPTPFGLNDLKLSVEILQQLDKSFGIIVNRAGLGDHRVYDFIAKNKLLLLDEIPFDPRIAKSYSEGKLITDNMPNYHKHFLQLFSRIKKHLQYDRNSYT